MSEVNKYFYALVDDRRTQFAEVKYSVVRAVEEKNDWFVRWHIKIMANILHQMDMREIDIIHTKKLFFDDFIECSLLHNNFDLTYFLLNQCQGMDKARNFQQIRRLSTYILCVFQEDVDMKFINYVDKYARRFLRTDIRSLCMMQKDSEYFVMMTSSGWDIVRNLLNKKQYEPVLYFVRIFQAASGVRSAIKNRFDKYVADDECSLNLPQHATFMEEIRQILD